MAQVNKIDSNVTGLRIQEETSIGVPNTSNSWVPYEPNSYNDFGGQLALVARNPINDSRQRKKGVITDLDASGGFQTDLTQTNLQDILQGFMFADFRRKGEEIVTAVDEDTVNPDEYEVAATAGFLVGSLIQGQGFTNAANNAVNEVVAVVADTSVEVATGQLVAEASPPADAQIVVVGHVGATADLNVDASGTYPAITSTLLDFTTLGLVEGEWIFIGGDGASEDFVTAANNGFKRVYSIATNRLEFDKSAATMVTETGTGLDIHLYFGRHLRNEQGSSIVRRTYQLERTLGAPDDALPSQIQAEYIEGAVPSTFTLNVPVADKITCDLGFVGIDNTQIDGATALKTGARPTLVDSDAFNTSSDFSRIKMAIHTGGVEAPSALFAYLTELSVSLDNNLSPNKAVSYLGAFDVTAGTFQVSASVTAYFSNVDAITAVRNNSDVTLDLAVVKNNAGFVLDLPLVALGDGRLNVEQDQPITLPLTADAATAAKFGATLDFTMGWTFFDYLPDAADI